MSRDEFIDILSGLVTEGFISETEAVTLVRRFDNGTLDMKRLPQALADALAIEDDTTVALVTPAGKLDIDTLQDLFAAHARAHAVVAQTSTQEWQRGMKALIQDYLLAVTSQYKLTGPDTIALDMEIKRQFRYLARFANQMSINELLQRSFSTAQIAARSELYSGSGRKLWFALNERGVLRGYVVDYLAVDDDRTCTPCLVAEESGPYLPGNGPYPGAECRGRGHCRCVRRMRYAPDEYQALVGTMRSSGAIYELESLGL